MTGYTWSFDRKKHQRKINRYIRAMNKNIERDELWQGRFVMFQTASYFHRYEDGSGAYLVVELCLYDKKTKQYKLVCGEVNSWVCPNGWRLFRAMNDFIVEDVDVWRKEEPRNEKRDYRSIPIDRSVINDRSQ